MKNILAALVLFTANLVFASGTTIGNGGNSIVCKNSTGSITSVEMLDLYEARVAGLTLKFNSHLSTYRDIIDENLSRWQKIAPYRVAQYKKWLTEFETEALFASGVDIPAIPDTGSVVLPTGCELRPIAFQRPDSEIFPGVKRYTVSKDLWNLMDEVQKAGLVMHELIYREGILAGHKTSFPTRYFNGYLATAIPDSKDYSYIVYRMPLVWTEVGGGMILNIGEVIQDSFSGTNGFKYHSDAKILSDGRFQGDGKIFSSIETGFINLVPEGYLCRGSYDDSVRMVEDFGIVVRTACWKFIRKLSTKIPNGSIELKNLSNGGYRRLSVQISRKDFRYLHVDIRVDNDHQPTVETNPQTSWIKLKNNHVIDSISKLEDSGNVLVTTKGERWIYSSKNETYILRK